MIRSFIISQIINRIVAFLISIGVPERMPLDPPVAPVEWPQPYDLTPLSGLED